VKAFQYHDFGGPAQIDEVSEPRAGPGELIVRVRACQIGGDVLKVLAGTGPVRNAADFRFPHTPGYRGAGVVAMVGTGVSAFSAGDRVVINGFVNCGNCDDCRRGLENLCRRSRMLGIDSGMPGALAEYVKVPERAVFGLPDRVSFPEATLLANMALSVHALERGGVRAPFTTAIFGCGLVGSAAIAVAKAYGASEIIGVDTEPSALAGARHLGATQTVDAANEDVVATLLERTEDRGVDVAIELVGVAKTIEDAIRSTRCGGVTILIGALGGISLAFPDYYRDVIQREPDIRPCFGKTRADFAKAVELAAAGTLDLSLYPLKEHPFDSIEDAIAEAADPGNGDLHVICMQP
jgi:L-iditol 2-dehydrogenase